MATPATHAAIARALAAELKAHPLLRGVRTWRLRDGGTAADDPPAAAQCPWVRLTPTAGAPRRFTFRHDLRPLRIVVETATAGRDFAAAADLAERLTRAITDRADSATGRLLSAVKAAGGADLILEEPPAPAQAGQYGDAMTSGSGAVRIPVYVLTS